MSDIQGGNLVFKAVLDESEIHRGFEKVKRDLQVMSGQMDKNAASIQDYADQIRDYFVKQKAPIKDAIAGLEELEKVLSKIKDGSPGKDDLVSFQQGSIRDLRERLKVIESEEVKIDRLAQGYKKLADQSRAIDANMKNMAAAGKQGSEEYTRLGTASKRIAKSLEDNEKAIKGMAEGYTELGNASGTIEGMGQQFQGLSGVMSKLGGENEALRSVTERLNSAFGVANDLKELGAAIDVKSIIGTSALTKVKTIYTGVLTRMTAALGGSAVAAQTLMSIMTLGLSAAIAGAMAMIEAYNAKQERAAQRIKERAEAENKAREESIKTRLELRATVQEIENFNGTKEQEKSKVEELNRTYGETFGHYRTLGEWYDVLQKKGEDYVNLILYQAKAQQSLNNIVGLEGKRNQLRQTSKRQFRLGGDTVLGAMLQWLPGLSDGSKELQDAIKDVDKDIEREMNALDFNNFQARFLKSSSGLGGYDDPEKNKKSGKEKDPFIKNLEAQKKAYDEYAKAINSTDEIVRNSADKTYSELLKGGKSYSEWLKNERNKVATGNTDLLKKWNAAIADSDTETVTGKLEKQIKDIISDATNKTKEKITELENIGSGILPGDPLKIEKEKHLQDGLTQLRRQSVQEEKKILEETLKEYGDFLQDKIEFEKEYGDKKAALNKRLTEELTDEERAATLAAAENLDNELTKIRNKGKIKGVELQIKSAEFKLEKALFETETKRYKWRADRDKDRLKAQQDYNLSLQTFYKQLLKLDPTKENIERINELLKRLGIEIDDINNKLKKTDNSKIFEMLEGIEGIAGALGQLDGSMGEVFQSISKAVGSVNQTIQTFNDDSLSSSEKNFAAAATIIEGVVSLINMATAASKNRKEKEREFYQNQIALAHEYALALNEQLLLQSKLTGSGFVRNYAGEINDAFSAATDAFTKYQEAMDKLEGGKAKTGLKDAIDWGNVGKGAATGAAAGAAIGSIVPVIGNAIGAVVGGLVGGIVGLFSKKTKDETSSLLEVFPELVDSAGNLNKELAQTLINTNQVDDSTKQLLQNSIEWSDAAEKANEQIKNVVVDLAGDLGNSLQSALVEAFKAGEDASSRMFEAASKSLEKFVENLVYSTIFSKTFKEFEDRLAQSLNPNGGDGNIVDDYQWLLNQMEKGQEVFNDALQQVKDYAASKGFDTWSQSSDTSQKGLAGAIKGISQETATIMSGHMNKQTILMTDGIDIIRRQLLATYAIEHNTRNIDNNTKNLERVLKSIDSKTQSVSGDLRAAGLG